MEPPQRPPRRQGSLLVDYSRNRAKQEGTPEERKRLSLENSGHVRRSSGGNRRSNNAGRRASMETRKGGMQGRRSSSFSGSLLQRASDEGIALYYHMDAAADARQPLNLYETKKKRKSGSFKLKKKSRQPSLIIEKKSGQRVSTVLELDSDMEDLRAFSDSSTGRQGVLPGADDNDDDDVSIHLPELEKHSRHRRELDDMDEDPSGTGTSMDDSDVCFALRRNVALPERSSTFDASIKSSKDRFNESLLLKTEEGEDDQLGRRSQLALARALHDSMTKLITDLEEEELNSISATKRATLSDCSPQHTPPRPSTPQRHTVPDRRTLLANLESNNNSMSKIINVTVADTVNWLVQASDEPVQTLERASSLRDMMTKQPSFSKSRRILPVRRFSRSISSSYLHDSFNSRRSALSRDSSFTNDSSVRANLRRSQSMRMRDSSSRKSEVKRSKTMLHESWSKRDSLRDFRKRSQKNLKAVDDGSSSGGTVDHSRRRITDATPSHRRKDSKSGLREAIPRRDRRKNMTKAASSSNVVSGSKGLKRNHTYSPMNSSSRRSFGGHGSSEITLPESMDDSSPRTNNLQRSRTMDASSGRRHGSSNGSSRTNVHEKSPIRRSHPQRGYSQSGTLGNRLSRRSNTGSGKALRRMNSMDGASMNDNSSFVTGSRITRL